jgi:uncharacterized protein YbjT (DUF2867 family)
MRGSPFFHNPFKQTVVRLIRSTGIDADTIRRAYLSLKAQDRDCMPYVPRLLAIEGR